METSDGKPYLRQAKFPEDFDAIVEVAHRAFEFDPVFVFWGDIVEFTGTGLKEKDDINLRIFLRFLLRVCIDMKARIRVVVVPVNGQDRIVSAAYWVPPNVRLELYQVRRLLRCGAVKLFKAWGLTGLDRITTQYSDKCHHSIAEAFKKRGIKRPINDSWYLILAMTDPAYQGRSFMSMLAREQYEFDPDSIYTLEATTEKSMRQYAHLGFELQTTFVLGEGKANAKGLQAKGEAAVGMEVFPMIKWPPSMETQNSSLPY